MHYRPEIDGIRTLAIIPVIIYHLKVPFGDQYLLQGGFLGVDVFLVLSGFLITSIMIDEITKTGTLNIKTFYVRRARRILPALFLVIFASLFTGLFVLTPTEMNRLAMSALAALGFVSNAYWYVVLGEYGATSGLLQPLLHTWSLAIEEQFYILFPLLLFLLKPARRPMGTLVVISACLMLSLATAEITTSVSKQLSFFSPLSRAWELGAGSVLALLTSQFSNASRPAPWLSRSLPAASLFVILASIFLIDLNDWNHPGLITVPVVLATAFLIWTAHENEPVTALLSTRAFVFIGRISYSLYLWHFPIFAFGRLTNIDHPGALDMVSWLTLTFICAVAGYYLIERPFRFRVRPRFFAGSLVASVVAVVGTAALLNYTDVLKSSQSNDLEALYGGDYYDNELLRDMSWSILDQLAGENEDIGPWNAHRPSNNERTALWFEDDTLPNILVIGNSHSKDVFNMLHLSPDRGQRYEVARFGIATRFPHDQRTELFTSPNFQAADIVMIAPRYTDDAATFLPELISEIQATGKTVVFVGNTPEFVSPGTVPIYDWYIQRRGERGNLQQMNHVAYGSQASAIAERNVMLREIARQTRVIYLSRQSLICSEQARTCILSTPGGQKTMYDYGHWTLEGAEYFGKLAAALDWLGPVFPN